MSGIGILVIVLAVLAIIGGAIFVQQRRTALGVVLIVVGAIVIVYSLTGLRA